MSSPSSSLVGPFRFGVLDSVSDEPLSMTHLHRLSSLHGELAAQETPEVTTGSLSIGDRRCVVRSTEAEALLSFLDTCPPSAGVSALRRISGRLLNADRARTSLDESSTLSEVEELLAQFRAQQQIAAELADMRPPSPPPLPPSLSKCKLDEMDNSAAEVSPAGVKVAETPLEVSRLLDRLVKRPSSPPKSAASGPLKKLTTGFSSFTDRLAKPFKGLSSSL